MSRYRRLWHPGGTYFFTHTLLHRGGDLLVRRIDLLRASVMKVRAEYPFCIVAWSVLPDHFHCVIALPDDDARFELRWRLIKQRFSCGIPNAEPRSESRRRRGERGVWQRRYWEHLIRDEDDLAAHIDYVHINPVKHGLVQKVSAWPHSTFGRWVREGFYLQDWAGEPAIDDLDQD